MDSRLNDLILTAPDPEDCRRKLEYMIGDPASLEQLRALSDSQLTHLVKILGISDFLYHFLSRHPEQLALIGQPFKPQEMATARCETLTELRYFKYQELLKITCMDLAGVCDYELILSALSLLAETVAKLAHQQLLQAKKNLDWQKQFVIFALGKLGSYELNYSSDIDLIIVCENISKEKDLLLQEQVIRHIRAFSKCLQEKTSDGFLYRVDLNLRPLGKSGPLILPINETEQYYEGHGQPWERFAWLRARPICGNIPLGEELLRRMNPFIFQRTLHFDDIQNFMKIKASMAKMRVTKGAWNIKLGAGGIRDIEFFVQILQLLNGAKHPILQQTNTMQVLDSLVKCQLLNDTEHSELRDSYLFLRRLEHRVQMRHELQTHQLVDNKKEQILIANSLGYKGLSDVEILEHFQNDLEMKCAISRRYFELISFQQKVIDD